MGCSPQLKPVSMIFHNAIRGRKYASLLIFTMAIFLAACSSPGGKDLNNGIKFHLDLTAPILKTVEGNNFYDKIEKAHFIPLETKEESLIGSILQIKYYQDKILILNRAGQQVSLLIFSSKGEFLDKIGETGKGPEEYIDASDFDISPKTNDIYILAHRDKKIMQYNIEGEFIRNIELNCPDSIRYGPMRMLITTDEGFLVSSHGISYDILFFNSNGDLTTYLFPYRKGMMYSRFSLSKWKDDILFFKSQNDTIYKVGKEGAQAYCYLDFGTNSFRPDKDYGDYLSIYNIYEGYDHLFLTFTGSTVGYCTIINKHSGNYDTCKWSENGLFNRSYPRIGFTGDDFEFGAIYYPVNISDEYNKLVKNPPNGYTFETSLTTEIRPEDNPVLMLMTLQ